MSSSVTKNSRGVGLKGWRLLIRNLKFETKEDDIRHLVSKFGEILEINLPKHKNKSYPNSCAGFCFIQFKRRVDAEKAKKELNFIKINGRKISLDWAMDKDSWITLQLEENSKMGKEIKKEPNDSADEDEEMETNGIIKMELKSETDEEDDDFESCHSDVIETDVEENFEDEEDMDEEEDDLDDEEEEQDEDESLSEEEENQKMKEIIKNNKNKKQQNFKKNEKEKEDKPRQGEKAIVEGRVVFLRNLPINSTDEGLKEWLNKNKICPFSLAILCRSKQTNYPTGSAFVHLIEKSTADLFLEKLESQQGMLFDGRRLIGYRAVDKKDANSFKRPEQEEKNEPKDKRNLYLLRASLIRKGTNEDKGMSDDDAKLREKLCLMAKKKLSNMITFVSPTRLAIHNIPFKFTDEQLRHLCRAAAGVSDQSILECRIMRQLKGQDSKGKVILGKSQGFGFVGFKEHTAALKCLKQMNNNPHIFTNERRPIVEFSIENLNALRLKERRLQKSRGEILSNSASNNNNKQKINNKLDEKLKIGNDPINLEKTKKELMKKGLKFLPKKFGEKKRSNNNDLKQLNKRRKRSNKDDNQKWKRKKGSSK